MKKIIEEVVANEKKVNKSAKKVSKKNDVLEESLTRNTLDRERNSLNTKASEVENKFLALLNYLAIFELGLGLLALWLDDLFYGSVQIVIIAFPEIEGPLVT